MARNSEAWSLRWLARLALAACGCVAVWIILGTFFASQNQLVALVYGRARGFDPELLEMLSLSFFSAVLTPFVVYVAARFPLDRPFRARALFALAATAMGYAVARSWCDAYLWGLTAQPGTASEVREIMLATMHTHFIMAGVIVAVTSLVTAQRVNAERRLRAGWVAADLVQAQVQHLQAELQPHFLFNTLNAAAALLDASRDAAAATLRRLADLLRMSMELGARPTISLREELEFTSRYLALQEMRFGSRLSSRVSVPDALLDARVPPLLLQPLAENAIVHGIVARSEGGALNIVATAAGDRLTLQVRDDGDGAEPDVLNAGRGVGVSNAKSRLHWLYGDRASLGYRREAGEFVAEVSMPLEIG